MRRGHGVALLIFVCALQTFTHGCGASALDNSQRTLSTMAVGVAAAEERAAPRYTIAAERARTTSTDWTSYDAAMEKWDRVETAFSASRRALFLLQRGLDAWRAGDGGETWRAAVPCVVPTLVELARFLSAVGVDPPSQLASSLALLRGFSGTCGGAL